MGLLSKAAEEHTFKLPPGDKNKCRQFLENYAKKYNSFHCILIKAGADILHGMVSHFGSVFDLENGACLVLVPREMDRQLLVHRLSQSLDADILHQCAACSPDEALTSISSFL